MFAPPGPPKPAEALEELCRQWLGYRAGRQGSRQGVQIEFWQRAATEGFTDETARASAQKFRVEFDALDQRLAKQPYLLGDALSVLDIAWFIYANRLALAGYPIARLHPRLGTWLDTLAQRPEFAEEVAMPPEAKERIAATRRAHAQAGKSLEMVAGF